jgi:hypothetical protein
MIAGQSWAGDPHDGKVLASGKLTAVAMVHLGKRQVSGEGSDHKKGRQLRRPKWGGITPKEMDVIFQATFVPFLTVARVSRLS